MALPIKSLSDSVGISGRPKRIKGGIQAHRRTCNFSRALINVSDA